MNKLASAYCAFSFLSLMCILKQKLRKITALKTVKPIDEDQSSNSQLPTHSASDLVSFKSVASCFDARPEHASSLGYFFSQLSCFYKDTSSQLVSSAVVSKQIKELGSLCDASERCAQAISLIKNLSFIRNLQVNVFLKSGMNQDISHTSGGAKAHPENVIQPESPMQEAVTVKISMDISDAFVRKPLKNLHAIGKK